MSTNMAQHSLEELTPAEKDEYKIYPQLLAAFTANLASLFVGMSFGWITPSLPKLIDPSSDLYLTSDEGSWIASAMMIGAGVGPILSGILVSRIGRKWFLYTTGVPSLLSWIITYFAGSFGDLFAARFINGLGVGGVYGAASVYLSEIAETRFRGAMGSMFTLSLLSGMLISYSVGPWTDRKTFALVNIIPCVLFLLLFLWAPETPYYYLTKNRREAAEKSLSWLRGTTSISVELKEMDNFLQSEQKQRGNIKEIVTAKANRRATVIVLLLLGVQQFSGAQVLISYLTVLLKKTSLDFDPSFSVIIVGLVSLLSTMVATVLIDKVGRRPLFLISACGSLACLLSIAVYFNLEKSGSDLSSISWIPLVAIVIFNIFSSFGLIPIPYTVLSEIYPTTVKGWITPIASIYGSVLGVIVTKVYQGVTDAWGDHVIFYGLCVVELVLTCCVFVILPETKGKSFKEIQDILNGDVDTT